MPLVRRQIAVSSGLEVEVRCDDATGEVVSFEITELDRSLRSIRIRTTDGSFDRTFAPPHVRNENRTYPVPNNTFYVAMGGNPGNVCIDLQFWRRG